MICNTEGVVPEYIPGIINPLEKALPMWDPIQYARYSHYRAQPFFDLLARVEDQNPSTIVDLGCGSGELTRHLLKRWPGASVTGVDQSPEMLSVASTFAIPGRLDFLQEDISAWSSITPVDLLVSNAAIQWVPDHERLIPRLAGCVKNGGTIAVQMPNNYQEASHQLINDLTQSPDWNSKFETLAARRKPVKPLSWYVDTLFGLGFEVEAWETEYLHILSGDDAVLEWLKGTALRPILSKLASATDREAFLSALNRLLIQAYPAKSYGVPFPFRRMFFVGRRR